MVFAKSTPRRPIQKIGLPSPFGRIRWEAKFTDRRKLRTSWMLLNGVLQGLLFVHVILITCNGRRRSTRVVSGMKNNGLLCKTSAKVVC